MTSFIADIRRTSKEHNLTWVPVVGEEDTLLDLGTRHGAFIFSLNWETTPPTIELTGVYGPFDVNEVQTVILFAPTFLSYPLIDVGQPVLAFVTAEWTDGIMQPPTIRYLAYSN